MGHCVTRRVIIGYDVMSVSSPDQQSSSKKRDKQSLPILSSIYISASVVYIVRIAVRMIVVWL